jgi:hypothetical protein
MHKNLKIKSKSGQFNTFKFHLHVKISGPGSEKKNGKICGIVMKICTGVPGRNVEAEIPVSTRDTAIRVCGYLRCLITGVSPGERSDDGDLAALSLRLLLEFEPRREISVNAENRLVEGHMRIAYSVPKHREYLRSGAPSEPILAEAAARVMESIGSIPNALLKMVQDGLISKGERGELVARLLLILAHDRAARKARTNLSPESSPLLSEPRFTPTHHVLYSVPILLVDFLRELVGEDHLQEILQVYSSEYP